MRPLRLLTAVLSVAALACGLLLLVNADAALAGPLLISGAILIAGLLVASAIAERK